MAIDVMQYFIHSHGFGADNSRCVQILLKGLRQIELRAGSFESSRLPAPSPFPTDNTRVDHGRHPQPVPGRFPAQQPNRLSTLRPSLTPTWPGAGAAHDSNSGYWSMLQSDYGGKVTISPGIVVQKVSVLGLNQRDYFVFRDHKVAEVNLASKNVYWSIYGNTREINYFVNGSYHIPRDFGDGYDNGEQLKRAVLASREFMSAEAGNRFEELLSRESPTAMAAFGGLYVTAQLTPLGWAADGIMAALFFAGCIMLGAEAIEVARLLTAFYDTATNARNNPAKFREAGRYLAQAVTKIGIDALLVLITHKASVPLKRVLMNTSAKMGLAAGEGLAGRRVRPWVEERIGTRTPQEIAEAEANRKAEVEAERSRRKDQQKAEKKEKDAKKKEREQAEKERKERISQEKAKAIEDLEKRYAPDKPPAGEYAKIEAEFELKYGSASSGTKVVTVIKSKKTGKVYSGRNGKVKNANELDPRTRERLPDESQHKNGESWDTYNCAEVDALDQAIKDGVDPADMEMHTVEIDRQSGTISDKTRCENCKVTTHDIETTSDPKK